MQNPFVMKAEASRSINDDPLQKFKFQVTMAGMPAGAGFSKVGGTSDEVDVIEYCEGMWDNIHKLPGRNKIGTIDFERGMYASRDAELMLLATRTDPSMRQTMLVEIKTVTVIRSASISLQKLGFLKLNFPTLTLLAVM